MEENNAVLGGPEVGGVHKRTLSRGMTIKRGAKGGKGRGGISVNSVKFEVGVSPPRFECVSEEWQSLSLVGLN